MSCFTPATPFKMLQRQAIHFAAGRLDSQFCIFFVVFFFIQERLEGIQEVLNTTEISLHQLTALVDCRSLHMVREGGWKEWGEGAGGGTAELAAIS